MKLYHVGCGGVLDIFTTKLVVKISELSTGGSKDTLSASLLDIEEARYGKLKFTCTRCEKEVTPEEIGVRCSKCENVVPLDAVHTIPPGWSFLDKTCFDTILEVIRQSGAEPPTGGPITLKIK
jgi:hypothetical protein